MNQDMLTAIAAVINLLMLILAVIAVRSKDLLKATILLTGVSLMASLLFVLMNAPDVAMAEASVGSALTAMIIIYAIKHTKRYEGGSGPG
jgi:energy-converting hydrogenase B subunit D